MTCFTIVQKGGLGWHSQKLLESFMHNGVFYWLFDIVCFENLGSRVLPEQKYLGSFLHFEYSVGYLTLFSGKGFGSVNPAILLDSFMHFGVLQIIYYRFFFRKGSRYHLGIFFTDFYAFEEFYYLLSSFLKR